MALGLTETDGSGTIIYYDLESFDGSKPNCVAAAQAFVAGWTTRMHANGNQAGLYGSACNPGIGYFAENSPIPDAVWVAQWTRDAYDPEVTVYGLACMDPALWTRSQRIRQYTSGHDETWGGVTLNIDSNVLDSLVADTLKPSPSFTMETPDLQPAYSDGMCGSGWYQRVNSRGYPASWATNWERNGTVPPPLVQHTARWQPQISAEGYFLVEAYVPAHATIEWACPTAKLPFDTATARYTITHMDGTTVKVADQAVHNGTWLTLGVYRFAKGSSGTVTLHDATDEKNWTRTVSSSALRFTRVEGGSLTTDFIYLPAIFH